MSEFIKKNFNGSNVTIGITGLPITITGEIINSGEPDIIGIRLEGGTKVYLAADMIAFVF